VCQIREKTGNSLIVGKVREKSGNLDKKSGKSKAMFWEQIVEEESIFRCIAKNSDFERKNSIQKGN